ncbi:MAG: Ig-like domain-containing protein, partial [Pirellulales bacterium]
LTETGRNTGRFEGEVLVAERTEANKNAPQLEGASATIIPALAGPITIAYNDVVTSGNATNTTRTATYNLDTTVPAATIDSPTTASESQNRLPTFTGVVTDNGSGIDVSTFAFHIDNTDDAKNTAKIIAAGRNRSSVLPGTASLPTIIGKIASIDMSAKTDGVNSLPFSYTETVVLPIDSVTNPDHIVDFQAKVADLAGNFGYSDSDTAAGNDNETGRHGAQPHTIKIDQIIPQISSVETGISWDTSIATPAEKADVNTSLVVRFDGKIKEGSVSASDFQVTLSGAGGVFVPGTVTVNNSDVYLDIGSAMPSDNTPTVKIQGTVQDLAGNSTDAGSKLAVDKLSPVLTVVRSGGSGTGTGTEAADSLTKSNMTVTITSDEGLQAAPQVFVTDIDAAGDPTVSVGNVNNGTFAVSAGGNKWTLVIAKGGSSDGTRAVKVTGTDTNSNDGSTGKDTVKAFVLDATLAAPVSTPKAAGTTTQAKPFLTTDFSADAHSITITSATLDKVDVTAEVIASADSKTFFYQPTTALTNA